jgi:hypothetical protein
MITEMLSGIIRMAKKQKTSYNNIYDNYNS